MRVSNLFAALPEELMSSRAASVSNLCFESHAHARGWSISRSVVISRLLRIANRVSDQVVLSVTPLVTLKVIWMIF